MNRLLLLFYVSTVSIIGVAITAWSVHQDFPLDQGADTHSYPWIAIAIMSIGLVFGEMLRVHTEKGSKANTVTFSAGLAFALLAVAPLGLVLLVQTAAILLDAVSARRKPVQTLFNCSQYAITFALSSYAFAAVAGHRFLEGPSVTARELVALAALAAVYVVVNLLLVGTVVSLASGRPTVLKIFDGFAERARSSAIDMSFAPFALAMMYYAPLLLPLLAAPALIMLRSSRLAMLREQEALHDLLTGLPNRAKLHAAFPGMLESVEGGDAEVAVMLIDLDHFKEINDTLGHHVGDLLLIEVAKRLSSVMRTDDVVARLGGDEFAVLALMPAGSGIRESAALADRLVEVLDSPFYAENVRIDVRGSVGLAIAPDHGTTMEMLMSRADIALYQAKEHRGCWAAYDPDTDDRAPEHLSLLGQLRDGIDDGQLEVHYQPKLDVRTGRVTGTEALVRWRHPDGGLLYPDAFIPMAEATGLIVPLTLEVLDQALAQTRRWLDAGWHLGIAVNLSVRHLTDITLPDQVAAVLSRHDVPAELLTLEVTEGTVMSDPLQAAAVLRGLRALGLRISLDDYGVGYCSLAYLCRLEVDELKIDRSLVSNLGQSASDALVVRSTIALAHDLGLQVVAEGIEDLESLHRLAEMHCDIAQGYYFSRAQPAAVLNVWLAAQDGTRTDLAGASA